MYAFAHQVFRTWLLLQPGADLKTIGGKFTDALYRNHPGLGLEKGKISFCLQPLSTLHLYEANGSPGQIKLVKTFDLNLTGQNQILLNETAVNKMGLKSPVSGQSIRFHNEPATIIGVTKDVHMASMKAALANPVKALRNE